MRMAFFRKLFPVIFLFAFSAPVFAQSRQVPNLITFDEAPYHFGFLLGVNQMLFTIKTPENYLYRTYYSNELINQMPDLNSDSARVMNVEGIPTTGFVIEVIGNLRLGNNFDLRFTPGLVFGERYLTYKVANYYGSDVPEIKDIAKNIQSTFVDFPLSIRFKGNRIHNVRPYINCGIKYSLDLASNARKKDNANAANVFITRHDYYSFGGVGFDFYTAYFKFGTELTMAYGIRDVLKKDGHMYTDVIDRLSSRMFQISFTFE